MSTGSGDESANGAAERALEENAVVERIPRTARPCVPRGGCCEAWPRNATTLLPDVWMCIACMRTWVYRWCMGAWEPIELKSTWNSVTDCSYFELISIMHLHLHTDPNLVTKLPIVVKIPRLFRSLRTPQCQRSASNQDADIWKQIKHCNVVRITHFWKRAEDRFVDQTCKGAHARVLLEMRWQIRLQNETLSLHAYM